MIALTKRNLKLYLRDRASVFFSLLSVIIIIGLYVLFLGDIYTGDLSAFENARELMDTWVMGGVLAVTSVTTTMGILSNMVKDRETKIYKDFYVSPMKKSQLSGGYLLSAYIIGVSMSLIAFVLSQVFIVTNGGQYLQTGSVIKILALILLISLMNTAIVYVIVSFFQSLNAFSTASTVIGTLIGFVTGIYLPIGMYPEGAQWIIKLCPFSHAALLFRQVMMEDAMSRGFAGMPDDVVLEVKKELGIIYTFGKYTISFEHSLVILFICMLLFLFLAIFLQRKNS
ncbi:MAG: multidrug/hemolysin transport system permease protein [Clostridiales bacterium]|nr:multidrug/hemolysin transport system permease protein [Clostridiales bacterium]